MARTSGDASLPAPDMATALMQRSGDAMDSPWYQAEKALYRRLLARQQASVLIVPFQSQYYAVDRIERSLMTRYLADVIVSRSDRTVANVTLVERALGETLRRHSDQEIFAIADDIGAEVVIKAYVGHRRDQRMVLTLQVVQRGEGGFRPGAPVIQMDLRDIAFSDEFLPSEAFLGVLDDLAAHLPFTLRRADRPRRIRAKDRITVPASPLDLVADIQDADPVEAAYRLQFLGALFPEHMELARERLFVRSLVALRHVDARSADHGLLKARALHYLNRRPAALKVLQGLRDGPEARALRAALNGDLHELEKAAASVRAPLHAYLAQFDIFDLKWAYDVLPYEQLDMAAVGSEHPGWQELILRRLGDGNVWGQYRNLHLKNLLDEIFPIGDIRAREVLASSLVLDAMSAREEIALSVYLHVAESLERDAERWSGLGEGYAPGPLDVLFLLESLGNANVLREIHFELFVQGATDRAMVLLDRFGSVYGGHPLFAYYRAAALNQASIRRTGAMRERLLSQAAASARQAYYWIGAQTPISRRTADFLLTTEQPLPLYNGDFPRRSFWYTNIPEADRPVEQAEDPWAGVVSNGMVALAYETRDFERLSSLHAAASRLDDESVAPAIVEANRERFRGHPDRIGFLARLKSEAGDHEGERAMYIQGMEEEPYNWKNHYGLGVVHSSAGEHAQAAEVFMAYAPFTDDRQRNRVRLSNWAYEAAVALHSRGAFDHARPLFVMSAGYQTGSVWSQRSAGMLGLAEGRYAEAAVTFRNLITRYNDFASYDGYISLLYTFGYTDIAASVLRSISGRVPLAALSDAVLTAHRLPGGRAELDGVLESARARNPESLLAMRVTLRLMDASPSEQDVADLEKHYQPPVLRGGAGGIERRETDKDAWYQAGPDGLAPAGEGTPSLLGARSDFAYFVDGYLALLRGDWEAADEAFDERGRYYSNTLLRFRYALPYVVRAKLRNGELAAVEEYLSADQRGDINDYVARALTEGEKGEHDAAIASLRRGMTRADVTTSGVFGAWYLLVETAEWLYEDHGYDGYRLLALEWAKAYQRMAPTVAWAYAVEAVHSEPSADRQWALALALYLDPASRRLHTVSGEEKEGARMWLDRNNPFILNRPDRSSVGI